VVFKKKCNHFSTLMDDRNLNKKIGWAAFYVFEDDLVESEIV
jgi:hypothetical protein